MPGYNEFQGYQRLYSVVGFLTHEDNGVAKFKEREELQEIILERF